MKEFANNVIVLVAPVFQAQMHHVCLALRILTFSFLIAIIKVFALKLVYKDFILIAQLLHANYVNILVNFVIAKKYAQNA